MKNDIGATPDSSAHCDYERPLSADATALETVVRLLEQATGGDQLDLPPIYHSVDPDAVDALMESGSEALMISFTHAGYDISIADGVVRLCEEPEPE